VCEKRIVKSKEKRTIKRPGLYLVGGEQGKKKEGGGSIEERGKGVGEDQISPEKPLIEC